MIKTLIVVLIFIIGCTPNYPIPTKEKQTGNFPIIELKYRDHVEYVNLLVDYHFIVDWDLDEKSPDFYVFNRKKGTRFKTKSWEKFVEEIQQWPNGVEIGGVARCTISFGMGIDDDKAKFLGKILQKKAFKILNEKDPRFFVFCYCETLEVNILNDNRSQ